MSKRFGKARVPNCECTERFTCRHCLNAAGPTTQDGAPVTPRYPECSICRDRHPSDDRHACE